MNGTPRPAFDRPEWVRTALERFEAPLLRYAAGIVGEPERARDVVQEVFLRLCAQDPSEVDSYLSRWLFSVCRNLAVDVIRKEKRVKTLEEPRDLREVASGPPGAALETRETMERVQAALACLPDNQAEVIRLKFAGGLSYREISEATGHSISNVGYLIHVGLQSVRARLNTASETRMA